MGGGGGNSGSYGGYRNGGRGGGIVLIGADILNVQAGGVISARGGLGQSDGGSYCYDQGGGGGAGGTVALFVNQIVNEGTIEAQGGQGGANSSGSKRGGDGGEGYVLSNLPIPGVIAQTYANGIEIWLDGQNVTAQVGDPNGKGAPHYNATTNTWGVGGTERWSSGPLDLSGATNWTLGEHTLEFKDTGGAGGDLKAYLYMIQTFSESTPPANDTCSTPQQLDISIANTPVTVSGTTEDFMGKTLATDAHNAAGCVAEGGMDTVYRIDLAQRSLISADLIAPFAAKMALRSTSCSDGEVAYCAASSSFTTTPLEPGSYYLWIDAEDANAKGNYTLTVERTPAPLPSNDTCETATPLVFAGQSSASASSTSIYSLNQYHAGWCQVAGDGNGPDVVYTFEAPSGSPLNVSLNADFPAMMVLSRGACNLEVNAVECGTDSINLNSQFGGTYYLFIDGLAEADWGNYDVTVSFE